LFSGAERHRLRDFPFYQLAGAIDLPTASRPLIEINEPEVSAPMLSMANRGDKPSWR
jgi:hypothetical protein